MKRRLVLRTLGALALFVITSRAAKADEPTLSGSWSATSMSSIWKIGDWGAACGPQPSGGGAPAGTVAIERRGSELTISGAGRSYSTTECWEQFPGLTRTSHSAGAQTWRNTCRTPPGDPRQASLVTTVTATPTQIGFDETGQYQFVIKGQNCTASVRRTRYFRPLATAADGGTKAKAPSSQPERVVEAVAACQTPGPPARLEVRPSQKLMRPGETFVFRARVTDAKGCALGVTPAFRVVAGPPSVTVTGSGRVDVSEGAPEGEVKLVATAGGRSLAIAVEVVSRERYDALLAERRFDESGASAEAAVAKLESTSIGARETVLRDDTEQHRTLFVAVVGGSALLLGLIGLVLIQRNRRAANAPSSTRSAPRAAPAGAVVCPTCRQEFPAYAQFCPTDGNRLVPLEPSGAVAPAGSVCPVCGQGYDPGVLVCLNHDEALVPVAVYQRRARSPSTKSSKICPVCGAQYPSDSEFCGTCGAALMPVN